MKSLQVLTLQGKCEVRIGVFLHCCVYNMTCVNVCTCECWTLISSRCLIFGQGESCVYRVRDVTCVNVCVGLLYRQDVSSLGDLSRCLIFRQGESCVYRVRDVTCVGMCVHVHVGLLYRQDVSSLGDLSRCSSLGRESLVFIVCVM